MATVKNHRGKEFEFDIYYSHEFKGRGGWDIISEVTYKDNRRKFRSYTTDSEFIDLISDMKYDNASWDAIQRAYRDHVFHLVEADILEFCIDVDEILAAEAAEDEDIPYPEGNLNTAYNEVAMTLSAMDAVEAHGGRLTGDQKELQAVLNVCFDLLSRTPQARRQPNAGIPASVISDMMYSSITGSDENPLNFRILVVALMSRANVIAADVTRATGIRAATISEFINDKRVLRSDNLEKIIRYCLK